MNIAMTQQGEQQPASLAQPQHQHQQQIQTSWQQPGIPAAEYPPPITRNWYIAKIVLGSASILFTIVIIAISITSFVQSEGWSYELVWIIPVAGLALCWDIAEFITLCARAGRRGIHPGAHVGLHLVLWLGFLVNLGLNAYNTATVAIFYENSSYYDSYWDSYWSPDFAGSSSYRSMVYTELALTVILLIIHFTLFVRACVETHRRNATGAVRIVYVQQPMYYAPQQPYGQPQYQVPGVQSPAPTHYSGNFSGDHQSPQPLHRASSKDM